MSGDTSGGRPLALVLLVCLGLGVLLAWLGRPQPVATAHQASAHEPLQLGSAYVWQRRWSPAVVAAVNRESIGDSTANPESSGNLPPVNQATAADLQELRVLALEIDAAGVSTRIPVVLTALAASKFRIVPVVRIDGRRPPLAATELAAALQELLRQWSEAGLDTDEVELDHDSARSTIAAYADWIQLLRSQLPPGLKLSVTGLPDWLHSNDLRLLLERVDGFTLQVHAADRPEAGLFDAGQALIWARRFSRDHPGQHFRIALPTYAARIRGHLHWPDPDAVEQLLALLRNEPVPGLKGVRWFRLPLPGATDTWSPATLRALMHGLPRTGKLVVRAQPADHGALDVVLANPTTFDWPLPPQIRVRGSCVGDGAGGYRLAADPAHPDTLVFLAAEADRLAPARQRVLGWLRCQGRPELSIDAQDVESPVEFRLQSGE